ncbi:unnamed protein product [Lactuca saligna]|uniref:Uncharacterized protein n=1 Tax=Lactuca saligna TaxID=75948 RepID=A0AA35ZGI0_LACSI|nr:unnamed protein product [Lactuca saligna]
MDPKLPPTMFRGGRNVDIALTATTSRWWWRSLMIHCLSWWDRDGGGRITVAPVVYFRSFTALQEAAGDGMMVFVDEVVGGTGLSGLVTQMVAEEAPMVVAATRMKEMAAVVLALGLGFEPLNIRLHT